MNKIKTKMHPTAVAIACLFIGVTAAAPALAVQSQPTGTVVGHAPVVTGDAAGEIAVDDSNHNGIIDAGDILTINTGKLSFTDADGDTDLGYTYNWTVDGAVLAAKDTVHPSYTIQSGDLGKKIKLSVVPYTDSTITDPAVGVAYASKFAANTALGITGAQAEITVVKSTAVASVVIGGMTAGAPVVGTALTTDVTLASGVHATTPVLQATLNYQWQIEGVIGSGNYTNIPGAPGTAASYTPAKGDQRKHIRVDVTVKNP